MPFSTAALVGVSLAVVAAAGLSFFASQLVRRRGIDGSAPAWGALAVGLAYAIGHLGVAMPSMPPGDVTDRIPWIAVAAAVVATILGMGRGALWGRVVAFVGLASLAWVVMLGPVLGSSDFTREQFLWLAGSAFAALFFSINVALLDSSSRHIDIWLALALLAIGSGVVLLLANSAVLFQLAGLLGVVLMASLLGSRGLAIGGGVPLASTILIALVLEGFVYAFLPAVAAVLLAAAPTSLWLTRLGPIARLGSKARITVALVIMLIPIGIAIGVTLGSQTTNEYGY
jgi:hypothetical protein